MKKPTTTVFISYNRRSRNDRTLVTRLSVIGGVHGIEVLSPHNFLQQEAKLEAINRADYFVAFIHNSAVSVELEDEIRAYIVTHSNQPLVVVVDLDIQAARERFEQVPGIFVEWAQPWLAFNFVQEPAVRAMVMAGASLLGLSQNLR